VVNEKYIRKDVEEAVVVQIDVVLSRNFLEGLRKNH
jgi:hypothetical protein